MKTIFLRVLESNDKAVDLRQAITQPDESFGRSRFEVDPTTFAQVPKSPFGYWASDKLRKAFDKLPSLHGSLAEVWSTNPLNEDFRYARAWWEVAPSLLQRNWKPWAKGGPFAPIYYDIHTVIQWSSERNSYGGFIGTANRPLTRPASVQHFFRPGLTWSRRTQGGLSLRVMPAGCIFGDKGPALFVEGDDAEALLALAAITNSRAFAALVELQMAFGSYEVGVIQRTPVPRITPHTRRALAVLVRRAWSLKRTFDTRNETSHAFTLPTLLQATANDLAARANAWIAHVTHVDSELASIQEEIDEACFRLYGIPERPSIEQGFSSNTEDAALGGDDDGDEDIADQEVDVGPMVASLLSWALGVAFGRFDLRLATGERALPQEPEPFDALPVCSPGMVMGSDRLPLATSPAGYSIAFPPDGILVDDSGHARDLLASVRGVFDKVFDDPNARWHEAAELVGVRNFDLRNWFARDFFDLHIKRYSKSRRKAPIYWQLATPSASYSVWIYVLRATQDTLFRVLNDFVDPKLQHEEAKLTRLTKDAGPHPSNAQRRELAEQETFVGELRAFKAEVARAAPLWKPDLNDGIIINFALLWRLVPQQRSWQMECRKVWDKLVAGEYDWAHLAMHLWPERVIPKCSTDRSLAIAHGLEGTFWHADESGVWHQREVDETMMKTLIAARTSSAVKSVLGQFVTAPVDIVSRRISTTPTKAAKPRGTSKAMRTAHGSQLPLVMPTALSGPDQGTLDAVRAALHRFQQGATKAELMAACGLDERSWKAAVDALVASGDVERVGHARGTRYMLHKGGRS